MRVMLNTLYINQKDVNVGKIGNNIAIYKDNELISRYPIHIFEAIVCSNYSGISPQALKLCSENNVSISFVDEYGFIAKVIDREKGNVLLRLAQYRALEDEQFCLETAKNIIISKLSNSSKFLYRFIQNNKHKINVLQIEEVAKELKETALRINKINNLNELRGIEGDAARLYFSIFDNLILRKNDGVFYFDGRIKHPATDCVNILLSYCYSLLLSDISAACQCVGLDKQVGYMHSLRVGRDSMSCDIIEEFRAFICDRFVLRVINLGQITGNDFALNEDGIWYFKGDGRKKFLKLWQEYKQEKIYHPYISKNIEIGLLPYLQATLMARYIRRDIEFYPPFLV